MLQRTDVIFVYDGSFDGFLCCVYEYYYSSFNPVEIVCEDDIEASLFQFVTIRTDFDRADRVKNAIEQQISGYSLRFLQECLLCHHKEKEMHMLRYTVKGFKKGGQIHRLVGDDDVNFLLKAHNHLKREKHLYLGIVRFYKAGDAYISVIKPKNRLIPLLVHHFTQRFANQNFMIYDATNGEALLYYNRQTAVIKADNIELPKADDEEIMMEKLWKLFYDTIAIEDRYNPRCRMNFMPKRTWEFLPEMKDL